MFSLLCARYNSRDRVLNMLQCLNIGLSCPVEDGVAVVKSGVIHSTHCRQNDVSGDAFPDVTKSPGVIRDNLLLTLSTRCLLNTMSINSRQQTN